MTRSLMTMAVVWAISLPTSDPLSSCAGSRAVESVEPTSVEAPPVWLTSDASGVWAFEVSGAEAAEHTWVGRCHPVGSRLDWSEDRNVPSSFWSDPWLLAPCEVRAYEQRGPFVVRSAPKVILDAERGRSNVVALALPPGPTGGVGFQLEIEPGGARVLKVYEGTPAYGVLEVGDLVIAVDGVEVAGANDWEFLDRSVGRVGSEVTLEWNRGGQWHRADFRREIYEAD